MDAWLQCVIFCVAMTILGDRHICAEQQRISFHENIESTRFLSICKVEAHTINQNFVPIFYMCSSLPPIPPMTTLIMGTPLASSTAVSIGLGIKLLSLTSIQIRSDLVSL